MTHTLHTFLTSYAEMSQRYQCILEALDDEADCDWTAVEQWVQFNTQAMEFMPVIDESMQLSATDIEQLKLTAESLLTLQDQVVHKIMGAKKICGQGMQHQRSTQKALQAYMQPQNNDPQFQDRTL